LTEPFIVLSWFAKNTSRSLTRRCEIRGGLSGNKCEHAASARVVSLLNSFCSLLPNASRHARELHVLQQQRVRADRSVKCLTVVPGGTTNFRTSSKVMVPLWSTSSLHVCQTDTSCSLLYPANCPGVASLLALRVSASSLMVTVPTSQRIPCQDGRCIQGTAVVNINSVKHLPILLDRFQRQNHS
jgi:hypothetical protein